jgi:electron transport complex protein RnfG
MNNTLRYTLVLSIIAIVMSIGIGIAHLITKDRIQQKEEDRRMEAIIRVLPGVEKLVEVTLYETAVENKIYKGVDKYGSLIGYAALGIAQGYNSKIKVMAGLAPDVDKILGISIVYHEETPGLGNKIVEIKSNKTLFTVFFGSKEVIEIDQVPWFCNQFRKKTLNQLRIVEQENSNGIHAITAATVTTTAVIEAVKDATAKIRIQISGQNESEQNN